MIPASGWERTQNISLDWGEFTTKGELSLVFGFNILAKTPGACPNTLLEWPIRLGEHGGLQRIGWRYQTVLANIKKEINRPSFHFSLKLMP